MATKWLTSDEMRAWRNFISTCAPLMDALERDLVPLGITFGDYEVLVFLSEAPEGRMRMCDLAQVLRLSPSGLTRRLDGLVRDRFVERQVSPADRRVMFARLTEDGMLKLKAAAPHHVKSVRRRLLAALDEHQIEQLGTIFESVSSNLVRQAD